MPRFEYIARDQKGQTVEGRRDEASRAALLSELRRIGLVPVHVATQDGNTTPGRSSRSLFGALLSPNAQDIEMELRQLAYMLKSGVTLLRALGICSEQSTKKRITIVLDALANDIRSGASFADALRHQRCFDRLTCSLAEVGEQGGNLDVVLERAANILARKRFIKTQVVTALVYPTLVLVMAIATVAYMMVGVIPKLSAFLSSLGRALPPSTQLLIDISTLVQAHFRDGLVLLAITIAAVFMASKTRAGRHVLDEVIVRTPVVGKTLILAATASFAYNLALLMKSGVRITHGLSVVAPVLPLTLFQSRVERARDDVQKGVELSESLSRSQSFDGRVTGMIAVGESSGRLDEVLENIADFHDERLKDTVRRLGAIVEPVILIVIGGIVGFVYFAFFSAVYQMAGSR